MKKSMVIGVCGGSGSGKSTLSKWIKETYKNQVLVVEQDMYYKEGLSPETNFDHPDTIDFDLLVEHLKTLQSGNSINAPIYDFEAHGRREETQLLEPKSIVVVEGILIYASQQLKGKLDFSIFVETDEEERLARRTERDVKERGRTVACVKEQFYAQVQPMHQLYVEPFKEKVDFVFNSQEDSEMQEFRRKELLFILNNIQTN